MKLLSRPPPDLKLGRLHLRPGRQVYYINIYFILYYIHYIHRLRPDRQELHRCWRVRGTLPCWSHSAVNFSFKI